MSERKAIQVDVELITSWKVIFYPFPDFCFWMNAQIGPIIETATTPQTANSPDVLTVVTNWPATASGLSGNSIPKAAAIESRNEINAVQK